MRCMMRPKPDQDTVDQIVDIASGKCFDWAQEAIAETMAAVAAALTIRAVTTRREIDQDEYVRKNR
jgi:hypothetical protein